MSNRNSTPRVPSYRRHKPSGQAVVTLSGCDNYLGKWNTKASRAEYERVVGEWLAAGRCLPNGDAGPSIAELALAYWRFAKTFYRKDGQLTGSIDRVRVALRTLREDYGPTPARALTTVAGLRKGRSAARESQPIVPVADGLVQATLSHLSEVVADMVRQQRVAPKFSLLRRWIRNSTLAATNRPLRRICDRRPAEPCT